jgi:F420-dependent oxidoreductase-like protein
MELGLHIADFTWSGGAPALGPALARHVREAEAAGIRRISVMDHFWQIRGVGPAEHEMLEAYSALGFIAAHTSRALLHTLVTGVIYREPALLAKAVTTLNVLSGGRAGLGIGAAWNEDESRGLGFDFPPVAERFEKLEEAIRICLQMWSGSEEPFDGQHYRLGRTLNSPQSLTRPHPYLMIGGSGEKKTLRLVAQYADACNLFPAPDLDRKLDVLRGHCADVGRDYDTIEKTVMFGLDPGEKGEKVGELLTQLERLAKLGISEAHGWVPRVHEIEPLKILGREVVPAIAEL